MSDREIGWVASLKDETTATAARIESALRKAGDGVDTFGDKLVKSGGHIREFKRAGAELMSIASRIGGPFEDAANSVGDLVGLTGEVGLFARAVADLGPKSFAAASAALGLGAAETVAGTAAAAATTEVAALAAAEGVASVGALALAAAWAPFLAIAAAGAVAVGALTVVNEQIKNSALDAAIAEQEHARAMGLVGTAAQQERAAIAEVTGAYTTGAMSAAQYSQKLAEIETRFKTENQISKVAASVALQTAAAFQTFADTGGDVAAMLDQLLRKTPPVAAGLAGSAGSLAHNVDEVTASAWDQFNALNANTEALGDLGGTAADALSPAAQLREELSAMYGIAISDADAALYLARGMNAAAVAAQNAAAGIAAFKAGHPTNSHLNAGTADAQVQYNVGSVNTETGDFDPDNFAQYTAARQGYQAPKKTKSGAGGKSAADAAKEEAAAIAAAYAADKQSADSYYDAVHDKNDATIDNAHKLAAANIDASHKAAQAAIEDAHKVANEQIQSARRAVDGQLSEQLRLNAAPVTAAEKALQGTMDAQRLRDLQEGVATAGADPKAIRSAQESLANFLAQQQIDAMKDQQALNDQAAHDAADAANALLDTQQATEDATYQQHKDDEDATYASRQATEDATYAARQAKEDARYELQKKIADDQIDAMSKSTKATEHLAQVQELAFLKHQLDLAGKDDPNRAMAVYEYNKFAKANPDLGALPQHATGLGYVPYDGYIAQLHEGERVTPAGQWRGGGGDIHVGGITVNGAGRDADQISDAVLLKIRRQLTRQGMSLG